MNIEELLILAEKSRFAIERIDDDFYEKLKERIAELEKKRENVNEKEIARIEDEIRTLKKIQRKIFEARTGKIIWIAWADVCETESGIEGKDNLIKIEREFLNSLRELFNDYKKRVFEFSKKEEREIEKDVMIVRIKQNIPEFEGLDGKTYKLRKEDVVVLPKLNAEALIKGGIAEDIEVKR